MAKSGKNRGQNKDPQRRLLNAPSDNEYDLAKNFSRINSFSKQSRKRSSQACSHYETTDYNPREYENPRIVEQSTISPNQTSSAIGWNEYTKLDDKISSMTQENHKEHDELRKELESKMNNSISEVNDEVKELRNSKLSVQWYVWTIIGLVSIVSVWFLLSYQDVHSLPSQVNSIKQRLDNIESSSKDQKKVLLDSLVSN